MLAFALTRWPGLLPPNFSAAAALAFCAGVYFSRRLAWWLPLVTLLASDIVLDLYYQFYLHIDAFKATQLVNYLTYAALIWMGTRFNPRTSWPKLLGGGILCVGLVGSILFYIVTNTAAWFFNPFHNVEYVKTLAGWITALTTGTAGFPPTWEFFRNTLLSGGIFTGLFVGTMKLSEAAESAREKEAPETLEEDAREEAETQETKA